MRPLRLDLEGFTVFRDACTVDFTDADFFALVGPTGSGKSTLLDAICFALYGTVPRWADQRSVAGALAPSSSQARVRLVFEAAGTRYVASRVVTRDGKGRVKTSLAGLQRLAADADLASLDKDVSDETEATDAVLGEVLAATPKEMDTAVPRVLGLPYDHFVTCVVLPQGEFAQFLHAKPSERGDILVNLLGLHVYRRIATRAGEVARDSAARAEAAQGLLGSLGDVDPAAVDEAAARTQRLRALRERVDAEAPALAGAQETTADARHVLGELERAVEVLGAARVPDDVASTAAHLGDAAEAVAATETGLAEAEAAEDEARVAAEESADPAELRRVLEAYDRLAELTTRHERLTAEVGTVAGEVTAARTAHGSAGDRLAEAELAHADAQRGELAGALRPHLVAGEPCPVCEQDVGALPPPVDATALRAAEKALAAARTAEVSAAKTLHDAERRHATARARLDDHDAALTQARALVADHGERADVERLLARADELRQRWRATGVAVRDARQAHQRAQQHQQRAAESARESWTRLAAARDHLAAYGPPVLDRDALDTAWSELVAWSLDTASARRDELPERRAAVERAEAEVTRIRTALRDLLAEHDLEAPDTADASGLTTAVAVAATQAESAHQRLVERLAQVSQQREERDRHTTTARVAKGLADHLRANNFERWLLEEALDTLVEGASRNLAELSGGQYELGHESGEFYVLDHHDADLRRPVRTLSGGETFQASLALALALSEQLAGMSSTTAALESILLDEGFGTLDATTLETVAATLENLAARGDRVVGVVTHVPALAERVPVRFELSKDARTARVHRVS
ncbi:MAG: AAA family ATPase [Streptosporangiales bacterium]|nr:AAA family ATPase [Streptosporangiales bacterium]